MKELGKKLIVNSEIKNKNEGKKKVSDIENNSKDNSIREA